MMAVTHELKTPVSVARLNLETMQRYSLDPERQRKLIKMTIEEIGRLNFLTNNILVASQLEGGRYQQTKEELDLSDLLKDCIQDFRNRFPDRLFEEQIDQDADVKGDSLLLQMLINNLIENARVQGYHVLIGGIDESNMASISMHAKLGFVYAGTIKHAGFKFGRWLNLSFYQLILDTPENPVDG